jgi:hypothetical protein
MLKCHVGHIVRPNLSRFFCDCHDESTTWDCKFHVKPNAKPIVPKVRSNALVIKLPQKKVREPIAKKEPETPVEVKPVDPKNQPRESSTRQNVSFLLLEYLNLTLAQTAILQQYCLALDGFYRIQTKFQDLPRRWSRTSGSSWFPLLGPAT